MKRNTKPFKEDILVIGKKAAFSLKNAGYTLLEMIVVVAMLAIGVTIIGMSINTIFSLEMRQCSKQIYSELSKEKIASMTRTGDVYMHLYKNSDGIYIDKYENDTVVEQGIKVGSAKVLIRFYSLTNSTGMMLDTNGIVIAFNKNNGSFKTIGQAWGLLDSPYSPPYQEEYYSKIVLSSGNTSRTIVLWPDTGKFSMSG